MTRPNLAGALLLVGVLSAGTTATVLFPDDETQMARGEPCTMVHLVQGGVGFDRANRPAQEFAEFHCLATPHKGVRTFTLTTKPNVASGFGCISTGFQFAGAAEGHGVPTSADGH